MYIIDISVRQSQLSKLELQSSLKEHNERLVNSE